MRIDNYIWFYDHNDHHCELGRVIITPDKQYMGIGGYKEFIMLEFLQSGNESPVKFKVSGQDILKAVQNCLGVPDD